MAEALRRGWPVEKVALLSLWDRFFVEKMRNIVDAERALITTRGTKEAVTAAKALGFGDEYIASLTGLGEEQVRARRPRPTFKMVDTCGGEFEAATPYFYSTYESEDELKPLAGKKVLIVGGGPIRIGQGVEFENCCVHGIQALREEGVGALIVNNNPETVSTDFDVSDRLYFEPLT